MVKKEITVSGMRPTGRMHLGQMISVIDNWKALQDAHSCYFLIANLHAMTDRTNYASVPQNTLDMVIDWLAAGIDPSKSAIFLQADVPEHAELSTILSMITPVSWLERNPVYKDALSKQGEGANPSAGFLTYPILQAADICLYKGTKIPVGTDQEAHIEIAREIVRRFNYLFGNTFPEPKALLMPSSKILGTDGVKMSKSKGNYISPSEGQEQLEEKIKMMVTDTKKIKRNDPGRPEVCSVYPIHEHYNPGKGIVASECSSGSRGCVTCKHEIAKILYNQFAEFREKRAYFASNPHKLVDILRDGASKAKQVAKSTMDEVRSRVSLGIDANVYKK